MTPWLVVHEDVDDVADAAPRIEPCAVGPAPTNLRVGGGLTPLDCCGPAQSSLRLLAYRLAPAL